MCFCYVKSCLSNIVLLKLYVIVLLIFVLYNDRFYKCFDSDYQVFDVILVLYAAHWGKKQTSLIQTQKGLPYLNEIDSLNRQINE